MGYLDKIMRDVKRLLEERTLDRSEVPAYVAARIQTRQLEQEASERADKTLAKLAATRPKRTRGGGRRVKGPVAVMHRQRFGGG